MILDDDYKSLEAISNSSMKVFRKEGPKAYFDNFIDPLRVKEREKSTESTDVGDLVDCLITQEKVFDKYYYVSGGVKVSADEKAILDGVWHETLSDLILAKDAGGLGLELKEALMSKALADVSLVGDAIVRHARALDMGDDKIGYRNNYGGEALANHFVKKCSAYYSDLGAANGRKVIDQTTYNTAVAAKNSLLEDSLIAPLFDKEDLSEDVELKMQFMVTTQIEGVLCKILLDYALINHKTKTIWPRDLKTAFSHQQFLINYKKYDYANQGSFYSGVLALHYPGYTIMPFEFIVCTTNSGEAPMIYRMSPTELLIAKNGGVLKSGATIPGWMNLIRQIAWHLENSSWIWPKDYYDNGFLVLNSYSSEAIDGDFDDVDEDIF